MNKTLFEKWQIIREPWDLVVEQKWPFLPMATQTNTKPKRNS